MNDAAQILLTYGVLVMALGFVLGVILGMLRMTKPPIRNLHIAHVETLMQAGLILGLAFAVSYVGFDSGWATLGAWLLVVGSAMQATGVTLNWLQDVTDQFAEKSIGWLINSASSSASIPGMGILVIGVLLNV